MKSDSTELLNRIESSLQPWKYEVIAHTNETINGVDFIGCVMTPRRWMSRAACAVVRLPQNLNSKQEFLAYANKGLKVLSDNYAHFPYYKELGTFLVVLCDAKQYEHLSSTKGEFHHKTGLHINIWLSTTLVDKENYLFTEESTWGISSSVYRLGAVNRAIEAWCEEN